MKPIFQIKAIADCCETEKENLLRLKVCEKLSGFSLHEWLSEKRGISAERLRSAVSMTAVDDREPVRRRKQIASNDLIKGNPAIFRCL